MRLADALRVQRGDMVAFVGAGGKTSALFRLAHELRGDGWRVIGTTTTRLARHEIQNVPCSMAVGGGTSPAAIRACLDEHGFVFLYANEDLKRDKIIGLAPETLSRLMDAVNSDVLLIEADGSRRLPLKAPRANEPVLPDDVSLVVPVGGVDALGQPLDEAHVFNVERIIERYGFPEGEPLLPPWMALTLRDPELGLRRVPESARVVGLLNKVPLNGHDRARARLVAQIMLRSTRVEAVALGAVQSPNDPIHEVQHRVAAVVLAAGQSVRMGRSKPLLPWADGQTVIETIVRRLLSFRFSEIVVVTGHQGEDVRRALAHLPVTFADNPDYASREMISSLQVGLSALPETTSGALVVLGDQPALNGRVVGQVLAAYAEGRGTIVAPVYRGERGHPVLFDRRHWPDLRALEKGAPRDVIRRAPDALALVKVSSDSILMDIDTPEQYRRARYLAGLR